MLQAMHSIPDNRWLTQQSIRFGKNSCDLQSMNQNQSNMKSILQLES